LAAELRSGASIAAGSLNPHRRQRREFAQAQFAAAQGRRPAAADNENRQGSPTGESAMNDVILFAYPTVAALGALVSLSLTVAALNVEKTNWSRARVPNWRSRSHQLRRRVHRP
jgi:hypothetical protein